MENPDEYRKLYELRRRLYLKYAEYKIADRIIREWLRDMKDQE